MARYASALAAFPKIRGAETTAILIVLPTRPREESNVDPLSDEMTIWTKLSNAGFKASIKVFQDLRPEDSGDQDVNILHVTGKT